MRTLLFEPKLFIILISLSLFIFLFDSLDFLIFPKSLVQTVTVPIQFGLYQSAKFWGKQFEFIPASRQAFLENKALKQQLSDLITENSNIRRELSETKSLVDQYNTLNPKTYDLFPARVIGLGRFLNLDKGSNDGVKIDSVVVFKDNYIGRVKEVNPKTSKVLLVQDPDSKIAVFSQGPEGKSRGILLGQFGSELLMDKILHQESINKGDLVYSEGTEGELPRGLVMGKVEEVLEKQNEVFKQAKIETVYKTEDLDMVFILKNQ